MTTLSPWMAIIAGPNGAGKSTFHDKILQEDPLFKNISFINLDNYAKELAGESGDVEKYLFEAGRMVRQNINEKFENLDNFIYETTASGRTHLKIMDEARKLGYKIAVVFIGLSDVELSHLRVQSRVQNGGHDVPPAIIDRRYPNVMKNFPEMLKRCDVAAVFDNSSKAPYKLVFYMDEKTIRTNGKYPSWVEEGLQGRKTSKEIIELSPETIKVLRKEQKEMAILVFGNKRGRAGK